MALEDYFPYMNNKRISSITIGWVKDESNGDFYNILITDKNNISVRDSATFGEKKINEEIDRLANILEKERGYSVIRNYNLF